VVDKRLVGMLALGLRYPLDNSVGILFHYVLLLSKIHIDMINYYGIIYYGVQ